MSHGLNKMLIIIYYDCKNNFIHELYMNLKMNLQKATIINCVKKMNYVHHEHTNNIVFQRR